MLIEVIGILVILYAIWFYFENYGNQTGTIPGPIKFPPFGNIFQVIHADKVAHIALAKLSKKYGDLMNIRMGLMNTIVFSTYDGIRDVFTKEKTLERELSGMLYDKNLRQNLEEIPRIVDSIHTGIGIVFSQGQTWVETRAFCRNSLRNYGFGIRETMRDLLLDELAESFKYLEQDFKSNTEGRVHIHSEYFHRSFANIMLSLLVGTRFNYDDPDFQYLLQVNEEFMKNGVLGAGIMMAFPFLRFIFPEVLGYNAQMKASHEFYRVAKKFKQQRKEIGHYKKASRCLTDDFLKKMEEEAKNPKSIYTEDQFAVLFTDLFMAGTDTASNVINFILLQLMVNSDIQEKLYNEISNVIGSNRMPEIQDKLLMPYMQAVILEGLRWSRVIVMGVPRIATADFTYRNYRIKKGTTLMYNLQSIFFNEDFWGDPQVFRPERFLDKAGNIDTKLMDIIMISFGAGARNCFGEVFGRDSIFVYITSMFQKFKFTLPPGSNPCLEPVLGIALSPQPYNAIVQLRSEILTKH